MVAILMMLETMASLGLLKIKVFLNKEYDVVISVHDVTKKNLITWLNLYCKCGHVTKCTLQFRWEKLP